MTGKEKLEELVKSKSTLAKAITALTETNSRLAKKVEHQAVELKKRGGGGVKDSGGVDTRGGNERSYYANCKQTTWHTPDNCFELNKNRAKRSLYWKSVLWRQGTNGHYRCKDNSTSNTYSQTIHNPIVSPSSLISGKLPHKIARKWQRKLENRVAAKLKNKKREICDDKDTTIVDLGARGW